MLGLALFITALFSPKTLVAPCPFCDSAIDGILPDRTKVQELRCKECYEYSVVQGGKVKPMDPATSNDTPRFRPRRARHNASPAEAHRPLALGRLNWTLESVPECFVSGPGKVKV